MYYDLLSVTLWYSGAKLYIPVQSTNNFLAPAVINAVSDIICNCFVSVVIEALLMKPQECSIVIRVISEKNLKWYIAMGVRELEVIMLFRAQVRVGGSDWATTNNQIMPIVV